MDNFNGRFRNALAPSEELDDDEESETVSGMGGAAADKNLSGTLGKKGKKSPGETDTDCTWNA